MDRRVFFLLLLGFSLVLSSAAVPASRSLERMNGVVVSAQESHFVQDLTERKVGIGEMLAAEERYVQGRVDIESSDDYPGTGANNHHEPKPPARR